MIHMTDQMATFGCVSQHRCCRGAAWLSISAAAPLTPSSRVHICLGQFNGPAEDGAIACGARPRRRDGEGERAGSVGMEDRR